MDEFRNRDSRLYVSSSKEAAFDFVRNERRIELAAEGQRYDDIRRYGAAYCNKVMNRDEF